MDQGTGPQWPTGFSLEVPRILVILRTRLRHTQTNTKKKGTRFLDNWKTSKGFPQILSFFQTSKLQGINLFTDESVTLPPSPVIGVPGGGFIR